MDGIGEHQEATVVSDAPGPGTGISIGSGAEGLDVQALLARLGSFRLSNDGAALIDQIRGLEDVKSAIAALQTRASVALDQAQHREQASAGVSSSAEQGQSVSAQIVSPPDHQALPSGRDKLSEQVND
jgi:hypothetical protein